MSIGKQHGFVFVLIRLVEDTLVVDVLYCVSGLLGEGGCVVLDDVYFVHLPEDDKVVGEHDDLSIVLGSGGSDGLEEALCFGAHVDGRLGFEVHGVGVESEQILA